MSILDFAKSLLFDLKYGQDEFLGQQEELGMGEVSLNLIMRQVSCSNTLD